MTNATGVLPVGVIGVGGMGVQHCRNIIERVPEMRLAAVCDGDASQAKRVGEELEAPWFTSHGAMIEAGLCQAALVATPHPLHEPIASDCFKGGLHVLSEKPLAECISAADRMVAASERAGRALGVMYQMRFIPALRRAIEIARAGELGPVIRATLVAPDYRSQAYYDAGKWRATWVGEGGGVLLNQSPHITDVFLALSGLPARVQGFTSAAMHDIEVEDCAEAVMRFRDGGFGYLYCSTIEPGPGQSLEVYGDLGKIIYRDGAVRHYRFRRPVREFTRENTEMWAKVECEEVPLGVEDRPTGHVDVMRNFARHVLAGEDLVCDGRSATAQVELANAITYSARRGRPVDLPLDRKAYDDLLAELRKGSRYGGKADQGKRLTDPGFLKRV